MHFEEKAEMLKEKILSAAKEKKPLIIAIDGRCASGKSTLAEKLSQKLDCNVIHTDDFYLQPFQRTEERYLEPGGNLDRERLSREVLIPLSAGRRPLYQPFDCKKMCFAGEIRLPQKDIYIVEGSYSCHPDLRPFYDITVFLTVDSQAQTERIRKRNGEDRLADFTGIWIPLEEAYFEAFDISDKSDVIIKT